jgi:hypothetical protein
VQAGVGLTAANFALLAVALGVEHALHGTIVYSAIAVLTLAHVPPCRRPFGVSLDDFIDRHLFGSGAAAIAVTTGVLMLAWPRQYDALAYEAMRAHLALLGGALVVAGGCALALTVFGGRGASASGALMAALGLLFGAMVIGFAETHVSTGVLTYGMLLLGIGGSRRLRGLLHSAPSIHALATSQLQRRIALICATALIGSSTFLTLLLTATSENRMRAEAENYNTAVAVSAAELLDQYMEGHLDAVDIAAQSTGVVSIDPATAQAALAQVLASYPEFNNLGLVDPSGQVIARAIPGPLSNVGSRPHIMQALAGENHVFGGVTTSATTGASIVAMASAVRDLATGAVIGAVAASIRLPAIAGFLDSSSISKGRVAFVVDGDGMLVAHPNADLLVHPISLANDPAVRGARSGATGSLQYRADNEGYLAGFSAVVPYGWSVIVEKPQSAALAEVWHIRDRAFLLLVLAGLALVALTTLATHAFLRPVAALVGPIAALGAGRYETNLPAAGDGEVGDVIRALGRMRDDLHDRE